MIDRTIDAFDEFAARFRVPISIVAGGWLVLSWASSAGFIELPEIAILTGTPGIIASSAFNGLWWGWLNPRIIRRRAERAAGQSKEVANG
ncbi:MAG TPA: hypothetical protein VNJ05_06865 [Sphingomicrobium sp.]|nr:hypothetical protein [Sphingomicrobium sp.]